MVEPVSGTAPYYAEAFSPLPGRCFRLVARHGEGGPTHCPEPPTWRGTWRAPNGRRYRVEACEGHRPPADPITPKSVFPTFGWFSGLRRISVQTTRRYPAGCRRAAGDPADTALCGSASGSPPCRSTAWRAACGAARRARAHILRVMHGPGQRVRLLGAAVATIAGMALLTACGAGWRQPAPGPPPSTSPSAIGAAAQGQVFYARRLPTLDRMPGHAPGSRRRRCGPRGFRRPSTAPTPSSPRTRSTCSSPSPAVSSPPCNKRRHR
jgi:hypothetical protein